MLEKKIIPVDNTKYTKLSTVYWDSDIHPKGCILYFHGGGLLYGSREDLPLAHLQSFTQSGYVIIAFDYALAPFTKIDEILSDVTASILFYQKNYTKYTKQLLPIFLLGRSAGAYLCLLTGAFNPSLPLHGILSYYGYGFLTDGWFDQPSKHYQSLPPVNSNCLESLEPIITGERDLGSFYHLYVYARQTGLWKDCIYEGRDKFFFLNATLRNCNNFPFPLFCTHSIGDPDVPFEEFLQLSTRFHPTQYVVSANEHDYDREENSPFTKELLKQSISFLDKITTK